MEPAPPKVVKEEVEEVEEVAEMDELVYWGVERFHA